MRILVLVVLAIIAYLLYKKFTAKPPNANPALDDAAKNATGETREIGSGATEAAANSVNEAVSAGKEAVQSGAVTAAQAATQAATQAGAQTATQAADQAKAVSADAAASLVPNTGDAIGDIQEMFKILNLRPSDASRLDLTAEQYENLKSGQAADLSAEILENVSGRLRAML